MNTIKDRLNEIIEYKELTATKFAGLINANPSAISHLLKGRNRPGLEMLENIAKAFPDISMDWLISGTGSILGQQAGIPAMPMGAPVLGIQPSVVPENIVPVTPPGKTPKRVILFYTDGSFEEYRND